MKIKSNGSNQNILTHDLAESLNGAKSAYFDINAGTGNLTIDTQTSDVHVLASGKLEYVEKQGPPVRSTSTNDGQTTLLVKASGPGKPSFRLPWAACNGETAWLIHLNPAVKSEITARSDGGNIKLDLTGMNLTRVSAETGGGNMDVVLPENGANLSVNASTGAGNVTVKIGKDLTGNNAINANSGAGNVDVQIPNGIEAKIHAKTGLGKVIMDSRFTMIDKNTYQSPGCDRAANKLEITVSSGAGNVIVRSKM